MKIVINGRPVAGQLVSVIIIGAGENGYVRVKRGQTYLDLESPDPPPPTHVDRIQVFAIPAPGQDFDIGGSWARADALTFELYESGVGTPDPLRDSAPATVLP